MTGPHTAAGSTVNTVLGPVSADDLGVVCVHEALLSVLPGAQYAYDIVIDRAEMFQTIAAKLRSFQAAGGGTVVDSTGMYHGRDVTLLEALSRSTGVHIVASTGLGPEEMLGGYFLTPQTLPPTPWSADQFAELYVKEITEGMVVPRVQRRAGAGMVTAAATREGMTGIDASLFAGAARAALTTGIPASIGFGADAVHDLEVILDEKLPADRVVVGGLDRRDAVAGGAALEVAARGAYAAIDHIGSADDVHVSDDERVAVIAELVAAGHGDRVLLSSDAIGYAIGHAPHDLPYDHLLSTFVPLLSEREIGDEAIQRFLVDNPRALLTVRGGGPSPGTINSSVVSVG